MVLYGIVSKMHNATLSPETAFTAVAVLTIVTHPANMVMTTVPQVVASFSSFERIQAYLLEAPWHDSRVDISKTHTTGRPLGYQDAIELSHMTVQDPLTSKLILEDVSTNIPRSDVVICCGATGSGKSSLAKVILGEIMPSHGYVGLHSRRVGYCDQRQWLPNGSIQNRAENL
jgi:ATP-binding cassette subfamily C (CFTR/MRP) protein 1